MHYHGNIDAGKYTVLKPKYATLVAAVFCFLPDKVILKALEAGECLLILNKKPKPSKFEVFDFTKIHLRRNGNNNELVVDERDIEKDYSCIASIQYDYQNIPIFMLSDSSGSYKKYSED